MDDILLLGRESSGLQMVIMVGTMRVPTVRSIIKLMMIR